MKAIIAIIVLALVYLFIPQYILYATEDSFSTVYTEQEKGFYSKKTCNQKGEALKRAYYCVSTSVWSQLIGKQQTYNKEREVDSN